MATKPASFSVQPPRNRLSYVPWMPFAFGLVAIICTGVWHHYSSLALFDSKVIAALISIKTPRAFTSVLPSLMAAALALVIIFTILSWALYVWRGLQQYSYDLSGRSHSAKQLKLFAIASGVANTLMYILAVYLVVMFAISLLWAGGGMIASKATMDGATTLQVVDSTLPNLIKAATGVDPAKGYLLTVAGREVDIGKSSCNLFCFTLARAMLADTIDCTCNADLAQRLLPAGSKTHDIQDQQICNDSPVMCSINAYAFSLFKQHMVPAIVAIVIALLSVLCMLMLVSGTFSRALLEQRRGDISRSSSADVQMRVDGESSISGSPRKGDAV